MATPRKYELSTIFLFGHVKMAEADPEGSLCAYKFTIDVCTGINGKRQHLRA